jgi:hypothetical protein
MTVEFLEDTKLMHAFRCCGRLADLGVQVEPAERYGVAIFQHERPVGMWSFFHGQYRYRTLANWEPLAKTETIAVTLELARRMAELDDWTRVPETASRPH